MSVTILATLVKPCKVDRMSTWTFFQDNDSYYATNDQGKRINCKGVIDARNFYKRMLGYGFIKPVTVTMTQESREQSRAHVKELQDKYAQECAQGMHASKTKVSSQANSGLGMVPVTSWT